MDEPARGSRWGLLLVGGLLVVGGMVGASLQGRFATAAWPTIACWGLAGLGWCLGLASMGFFGGRSAGPRWSSRAWLLVLVVALFGRAAAWSARPELSDDLWRYGWEGALVLQGQSPYAQAPDAASLAGERERWSEVFARLNNRSVSAAYPPVTQAFAAATVALAFGRAGPAGPQAVARLEGALRLAFGFAELGVLLLLVVGLPRLGQPREAALVWAWSPLVMTEFWTSAHFDSLGIVLLVAAFVLLGARPREAGAAKLGGVALGLAIAVKYLPLLFVPLLGVRRWVGVALTLVVCFAPVGLLAGGHSGLLTGLGEYGFRWESWNLAYRFVEAPLAALFERDETWSDPRRLGRFCVGLVLVVVVARQALRVRSANVSLGAAAYPILAAFLALSPTLHPWYLAWILPLLVLTPSASRVAWVVLVAASPLLYLPVVEWQTVGTWSVPGWTWPVLGLPFWGLALGGLWLDRRRDFGSAAGSGPASGG